MACIIKKKNSPYCYVKYYVDGKPFEISTRSRNRKVATRICHKIEDEIALGNFGLIPLGKNITVETWRAEFLADKKTIHTAGSFDRCSRNINKFLEYCGEVKTMRQFTSQIIKSYIQKRGQEVGDWALKNEVVTLKSFFNDCEKAYKILSPMRDIKVKKPLPKSPNIYTQEEIRIMSGIQNIRDKALLLLDLLTGLRKGEMASRKWKHIDWAQEKVWVRVEEDFVPKDKETRFIPLNPVLKDALAEWHKESRQNREEDFIFGGRKGKHSHFDVLMGETLRKRGIKGHCKKFRDTAASYWLASGVPLQNVKEWLGHYDIKMTNHYLNYLPKAIEPDIRKIFGWKFGWQ